MLPCGADSHYVIPDKKGLTTSPGVEKPHENHSKPAGSQPDADTANIRLDLSDRGTRQRPSQRTTHEVIKTTALQETLARERSQSTSSSSSEEEEGAYIAPTDIASYPTPMARKVANSRREASVSPESDLYLQM